MGIALKNEIVKQTWQYISIYNHALFNNLPILYLSTHFYIKKNWLFSQARLIHYFQIYLTTKTNTQVEFDRVRKIKMPHQGRTCNQGTSPRALVTCCICYPSFRMEKRSSWCVMFWWHSKPNANQKYQMNLFWVLMSCYLYECPKSLWPINICTYPLVSFFLLVREISIGLNCICYFFQFRNSQFLWKLQLSLQKEFFIHRLLF